MAISITGCGKVMDSSIIGWCCITQRIARESVTQTHSGADVAGTDFIDIFAVVGMHTQQTPNTFSFALRAIFR